jgi:hypothetical protein
VIWATPVTLHNFPPEFRLVAKGVGVFYWGPICRMLGIEISNFTAICVFKFARTNGHVEVEM